MSAFFYNMIDMFLLTFLLVLAIGIVRSRDIFNTIIYSSAFSMVMAALFLLLDAADVAFTEAAIGASLTLIFFIIAISLTKREEKSAPPRVAAFIIVFFVGALLLFGTQDLPSHGDASAPVHQHVAPHYLANALAETSVPNVVTAVLASYRGFDTLGELYVIFMAGVAVLMLIGIQKKGRKP